jgi:hypothetical protein
MIVHHKCNVMQEITHEKLLNSQRSNRQKDPIQTPQIQLRHHQHKDQTGNNTNRIICEKCHHKRQGIQDLELKLR